jgi:hypothetical protein
VPRWPVFQARRMALTAAAGAAMALMPCGTRRRRHQAHTLSVATKREACVPHNPSSDAAQGAAAASQPRLLRRAARSLHSGSSCGTTHLCQPCVAAFVHGTLQVHDVGAHLRADRQAEQEVW